MLYGLDLVQVYMLISEFRQLPFHLYSTLTPNLRKLASSKAREAKPQQPEPKGFSNAQKNAMLSQWKFICTNVHTHADEDRHAFVDPFVSESPPSISQHVSSLPTQQPTSAFFTKVDLDELNRDARPFLVSSTPLSSPTKSRAADEASSLASKARSRATSPSKSKQHSPGSSKTATASSGSSGVDEQISFYVLRFDGGVDFFDSR
jgi:hypothetical protein